MSAQKSLSLLHRLKSPHPVLPNPGSFIPLRLKIHINHLTALVYGPPEIMLLAIDLHENFIDEESISVALVFSLQPACINGAELDPPEAYRFSGYSNATFSEPEVRTKPAC